MRVLLDTCVIIDALQERVPFSKDAKKIFLLCANEQFIGYITAKASTDIYYLIHKVTHDNKKSRFYLNQLFSLFECLDTTGTDCKKAIASQVSDYEDAVMIESATNANIDCIITRNEHDFSHSTIPIVSPHEFIKIIENND